MSASLRSITSSAALACLLLLTPASGWSQTRGPRPGDSVETPARSHTVSAAAPRPLLRQSIEAMGGEARWQNLRSLRVEWLGHQHALEQSERPEGPWVTTYLQVSELKDLVEFRMRRTESQRGFWSLQWQTSTVMADPEAAAVVRGERVTAASVNTHAETRERLALGPERILMTALAAPDLDAGADTLLWGVPHDALDFTWDRRAVTLYVNRDTRLPAGYAIEAAPGDPFSAIWGDTRTHRFWSLWSLEPGGWLYPRQSDSYRLDRPYQRETVVAVAFDQAVPPDSFDLADEVRQSFPASAARALSELRPGMDYRGEPQQEVAVGATVVTVAGFYATTFVEQSDGVVILDAPVTSAWSRRVLDEAARRYPGKAVKMVISTSDAWLHIGGLREYVAREIPIVVLDLNRPIVESLLSATHARRPDSLAATPRAARFVELSEPLTIGTGHERLVLYPVRGEGGERMMVAYLPETQVLYASDLIQMQSDGSFFWPEYLANVEQVVVRHGLEPRTVFAMHMSPIPWARVQAALGAARQAERVQE